MIVRGFVLFANKYFDNIMYIIKYCELYGQ